MDRSIGNFDFVMRIIKEQEPCIIFIDEIDMLNLHRDKFKDKNVSVVAFVYDATTREVLQVEKVKIK